MRKDQAENESEKNASAVEKQSETNTTSKGETDVLENAANKEKSATALGRRIGRYISKFTKSTKATNLTAGSTQIDETKTSLKDTNIIKQAKSNDPSRTKENAISYAQSKTSGKQGQISDCLKNKKELNKNGKEESVSDNKTSSVLRRSSSLKKSRYSNRRQKAASVTFSPTVTVTSRDPRRTKSLTTRTRPYRSRGSTTSETSDTDSTSQSHSSVGKQIDALYKLCMNT